MSFDVWWVFSQACSSARRLANEIDIALIKLQRASPGKRALAKPTVASSEPSARAIAKPPFKLKRSCAFVVEEKTRQDLAEGNKDNMLKSKHTEQSSEPSEHEDDLSDLYQLNQL